MPAYTRRIKRQPLRKHPREVNGYGEDSEIDTGPIQILFVLEVHPNYLHLL